MTISMYHCSYCDPKFYVIYGCCKNCNRKCEVPLYDYKKSALSLKEYDEFRNKWYEQIS
jgi:hypothetical protein